jgi:hypothetical protein
MPSTLTSIAFLLLASVQALPAGQKAAARDDSAAERLGWRLGVQAWTFRDRSAFEAIDTAARLGLKYIELYPGQVLCPGTRRQGRRRPTPAQRAALRGKLARRGDCRASASSASTATRPLRAASRLRQGNGPRERELRARAGGADQVAKLCAEYGIKAASTTTLPSRWDPETVLPP